MRIDRFAFGTIVIDGETYRRDVVLDRGQVRPRKKKPSKRFRAEFGHTPLSPEEKIPWNCEQLVIGTGAQGSLPVMPAVLEEAKRRGVEVAILTTPKAVKLLQKEPGRTNAVLHVTC
jgi:hypothetical protein